MVMRLVCTLLVWLVLGQGNSPAAQAPPGDELRQLLERVIAATHRGDAAEQLYARTEHWEDRKHPSDPNPTLDRLYRVYPTGTGTIKLVVTERGSRVTPERYREELGELQQALQWAIQPDDAQRQRIEKWKKRSGDRYHAVEAFRTAYSVTWLGREQMAGRAAEKLLLDPKPGSVSGSATDQIVGNSRLILWVDPASGAIVRMDAELVNDVSFGGGLLGKIYKGGRIRLEQVEIAPGLWLPGKTTFEARGRKLLFSQEVVRTVEASGYRRVGPPEELLPLVRRARSNASLQVPEP
jgi:hypothetical protein